MSLEDFRKKIENTKKELIKTQVKRNVKISHDLAALISLRVINTGKNAKGGYFTKYSNNAIPIFKLGRDRFGNDIKANFNVEGVRTKLRKKHKNNMAPYKSFRAEVGRQVNFKNFSLTNSMWKSVIPFVISSKPGIVVIGVGIQNDKENEFKLSSLQKKETKNIIAASIKELTIVNKLHSASVKLIYSKNKLTLS